MTDHFSSNAQEYSLVEKVLLSTIVEQRRARRWKIFFRFIYLALFLLILAAVFFNKLESDGDMSAPHTALVTIKGEIGSETPANADAINQALSDAFNNHHSAAIILAINSPGGSPVQADRIYREIWHLREQFPNKPLYVVVDDLCASAGYYIASAANKIFVNQASLVGSIGVTMSTFGFTELMKKIGLERRLLIAGQNKDFLDPFSEENPQQKVFALSLLSEVHQQFIAAVKKGRGTRLKNNPDLFSGLFWTGAKSIELGLTDDLGSVNSVAQQVVKVEKVVDYTLSEDLSDRILKKIHLMMKATLHSVQEMQLH